MNNLQAALIKQLSLREAEGSRRYLKQEQHGLVDFTSNDYLGLARSKELFQSILKENARLHQKAGVA